MATITNPPALENREICELARICEALFEAYANPIARVSSLCQKAELQRQRFCVWASCLGVFADTNASLDKRLRRSDEVRAIIIEQLCSIRTNLEFASLTDPDFECPPDFLSLPVDAERRNYIQQLDGTPLEALEAIEATIGRLFMLGSTLRTSSTAKLESRIKGFTEKYGDVEDFQFSKAIIQFKFAAASPSLQEHLASTMTARRQRLRYLARHHAKLAGGKITTTPSRSAAGSKSGKSWHNLLATDERGSEKRFNNGKRTNSHQTPNDVAKPSDTISETTVSSYKFHVNRPGSALGQSVLSSKPSSTTTMAEMKVVYPEAPKPENGKPEPQCPYCYEPIQHLNLKNEQWSRHVEKDLRPFVCLFENCDDPNSPFDNLQIWAAHMRNKHSRSWADIVGEAIAWECNAGHEVEKFVAMKDFEDHLNLQHIDDSATKRQAIITASRVSQRRSKQICPLCNTRPGGALSESQSGAGQNDVEFQQLERLVKHIAKHLQQLALYSVINLAVVEGDGSQTGTSTSNRSTGNSPNAPRSSEYGDLASLSLAFEDHPSFEPIGQQDKFDREWKSEDSESQQTSPPELPPSDIPQWSQMLKRQIAERAVNWGHPNGRRVPNKALLSFIKYQYPVGSFHVGNQSELPCGALVAFYLGYMWLLAEEDLPKSLLPRAEDEQKLSEVLAILKAWEFITENEEHDSYNMDRPTRLAMGDWFDEEAVRKAWNTFIIQQLSESFPFPTHENRVVWKSYLPHAEVALKGCQQFSDKRARSKLLSNVAAGKYLLGEYGPAAAMYEESFELHVELVGPKHPTTLSLMCNIANCKNNQGNFTEAEILHEKTLYIRTETLGVEHAQTLSSMAELANTLFSQGKYEQAASRHRQVLTSRQKVLGREHPHTISSMGNLANVFEKMKEYEKARVMYAKTLEESTAALGDEHPYTISSKGNLANSLERLGEYKQAEEIHRETMLLRMKVLGPHHPHTLSSAGKVAYVLLKQEKYAKAEELYEEVLEWRTKILGADHPDTRSTESNLAKLHQRQEGHNEVEEARETYRRPRRSST